MGLQSEQCSIVVLGDVGDIRLGAVAIVHRLACVWLLGRELEWAGKDACIDGRNAAPM